MSLKLSMTIVDVPLSTNFVRTWFQVLWTHRKNGMEVRIEPFRSAVIFPVGSPLNMAAGA